MFVYMCMCVCTLYVCVILSVQGVGLCGGGMGEGEMVNKRGFGLFNLELVKQHKGVGVEGDHCGGWKQEHRDLINGGMLCCKCDVAITSEPSAIRYRGCGLICTHTAYIWLWCHHVLGMSSHWGTCPVM